MNIPPALQTQIIETWGDEGRAWLAQLPTLLERCAKQWDLSLGDPAPDLSYNYVTFAVTAAGSDVVLKVGVPNPELFSELATLKLHRGKHVVTLLDADETLGALLMQRIRPGTTLSKLSDDIRATEIAAPIIRDFPIPEPAEHNFPTVKHWALVLERIRHKFDGKTGPWPRRLFEKAERLFQELHASSPTPMLLHGDLHHDNILADHVHGWRVIDPKGVIGDPAYEAARFQHNPPPGLLVMDQPRQVAARRADILASITGIDRDRLLAWAFFDNVLGSCWTLEDEGDIINGVAQAELFDTLVD